MQDVSAILESVSCLRRYSAAVYIQKAARRLAAVRGVLWREYVVVEMPT